MNMATHLRRSAKLYANNIAIVFENTRITYREFNEQTNRLGNALIDLGLDSGDRVAFFSQNCHQLIIAEYACHKAGLVAVPLNVRSTVEEMVDMINHSGSRVLFIGSESVKQVLTVKNRMKMLDYIIAINGGSESMLDYEETIKSGSSQDAGLDSDIDSVSHLKYTSGTTGTMKAVMWSHRNRICLARKILMTPDSDIDPETVVGHVGPITHGSGALILAFIIRGACNLVLKGFDMDVLLATIQKERITHFFTVPTMLEFLMEYPELDQYDLSSIRSIVYGGAPMTADRIAKALDIFGPVLAQAYGQTESSGVMTYLSKQDHLVGNDPVKKKRLSSVGIPNCDSEVRIVNEKGLDIAPNEVGEVIEKGDDTMIGYWNNETLTAETLKDGWLYTSDLATVDETGYIFLIDRKSDMIITGGFNVYPSEIESVLDSHPEVLESAVIGVKDKKWGEAIKGVVVTNQNSQTTVGQLIEHCKKQLPGYKCPKSIDFIQQLPKNPIGKIVRKKLRDQY